MKLIWSDKGINFPETDKILSVLNEWYSDDFLSEEEVLENLITIDLIDIKNLLSDKGWINLFDRLALINCEVIFDDENILIGVKRLISNYINFK